MGAFCCPGPQCRQFAQRDLSVYQVSYLFIDGNKREPVLVAWGFTVEGRRVLLHLMPGSKEDAVLRGHEEARTE
jgi:hypothetical protein